MPALLNSLLRAVWLAAVLGLLAVQTAAAATNVPAWQSRPWTSKDGLPNNTVNGLAQTPDGYLWIGTPNGLTRFDGVRFEDFPGTNFVELPNRGVKALIGGRPGGLCIGMDRGAVIRLEGRKPDAFVPDEALSRATINSLTEDREGALWIAYRGGGVRRLKDGKLTQFGEREGLPAGVTICSLTCDPKGRLWFVKNGQLGIIREGRFQTLARLETGTSRLTFSRSGGVWACAGFHLYKFDEGGTPENHGAFTPRRAGTEPSAMIEDQAGAVWIGTTFSGLFRYDGSGFENIPTTHPEILCLLEDAEGNTWAGTGGGGLNQIRPRALTLETAENGLPFDAAQSLCEDTNGVIWAATQNGALARQIDGRWEMLTNVSNWTGDALTLSADPAGGVWIGTRLHRLLRWHQDGFTNWGDARQVKGQTVRTLVAARNGDVWLGEDSPTSIQRLRGGKLDDFELPPEIRVIRASAEDAAGHVWFGTSGGILLRSDDGRLVDETERMLGTPQSIRCLYGTPDGSLWIGFAGAGVGRIKNGHFAAITQRHGLFDDWVSQILADGHGWLWFAADHGIFKVRQQELDDVAEGRAERVRSILYGQDDSLPSLQGNLGNAPIALRSHDGRLWLAMRTGLVIIDPANLHENSQPPPVLLGRVSVSDRTVAAYSGVSVPKENGREIPELATLRGGLRVPPDHKRMDFEFTALSFIAPENVAFRHRLVGSGEDWVSSSGTEKRSASYVRLPAGKYEFQVNACNSEGVWNDVGASLSFEVTPFFWNTWWFRGTALFAFTATLIAIVRYVSFRRLRAQLRVLEAQAALHKERARIAKDIHDDLGANLTQISLLGELAHQDRGTPDKVSEYIDIISNTARRAVKSLDEIVWAVNPRNDTLAHFIDYTGQYALDYLRVAGIRCRLDLPEQTPERELSTDVRHNLFLVVKEAINNSVKHAHATELQLRINVNDEKLAIIIEDNGCGFERPPADPGADGLRNMSQRVADIGGECSIRGQPGGGTTVSVALPWSRIRNET